jgi:tetratricopeptide (TPR) repeat protein
MPQNAPALFGLGWARQAQNDLASAEALYLMAGARAMQAHDTQTEYFARYNLGTLYVRRGEVDRARSSFERALVAKPGDAPAADAIRSLGPAPAPSVSADAGAHGRERVPQ